MGVGLTGHSGMSRAAAYCCRWRRWELEIPAPAPPPPTPASLTRSLEGSTGTQLLPEPGEEGQECRRHRPDGTEGTGRGGTESLGWGRVGQGLKVETEIARLLLCRLDGEGTAGGAGGRPVSVAVGGGAGWVENFQIPALPAGPPQPGRSGSHSHG